MSMYCCILVCTLSRLATLNQFIQLKIKAGVKARVIKDRYSFCMMYMYDSQCYVNFSNALQYFSAVQYTM